MFILASASPRRRALLRQIGAQFVSIAPAVAERKNGEHPRDDVIYNALTKARKVAEEYPDHAVLGADTAIVLGGKSFGKPRDAEEARHILSLLEGRQHTVLTGIAWVVDGRVVTDAAETTVRFAPMSPHTSRRASRWARRGRMRFRGARPSTSRRFTARSRMSSGCPSTPWRRLRARRASSWRRRTMPLSDLPHGELPRERLLAHGAAVLSDAELLAVLLRTGRTGEHVLDLARGIVAQFREEGLAAILRMPAAEFARIPGIGGAKAATVLAALELGRRAYAGTRGMPHLNEAADVMTLLSARCHAERREHFFVLPLSAKNELLMLADVSTGTLTNALVHPREVFEPAIRCGAAHVIVAHNHPSGDPTPSAEDHRLTRSLYEAGKLLGIPVTDHVVVARNGFFSFAEEGLM